MSERLADINARIEGIRQLGAVVNAMRGIAAARARQAWEQLAAVDAYADTIAAAIGRTLPLLPPARADGGQLPGRRALVLFSAEQGFAGAYSERLLDAAANELAGAELFLVGTRGAAIAAERGLVPYWQGAMPAHSPGIPKLANIVVEALYKRLARGGIGELVALFTGGQPGAVAQIERRRLLPLPTARFPPSAANPPLVNLPPDILLSELSADYLHAEICQAALHAFAAENGARLAAMTLANGHIERQLAALQRHQRQVRQEEITLEIIELASGQLA